LSPLQTKAWFRGEQLVLGSKRSLSQTDREVSDQETTFQWALIMLDDRL